MVALSRTQGPMLSHKTGSYLVTTSSASVSQDPMRVCITHLYVSHIATQRRPVSAFLREPALSRDYHERSMWDRPAHPVLRGRPCPHLNYLRMLICRVWVRSIFCSPSHCLLFFFYLQKEKNNSGNFLSGTRSLESDFEFYRCLEISHRIFRVYDADSAAARARHSRFQGRKGPLTQGQR